MEIVLRKQPYFPCRNKGCFDIKYSFNFKGNHSNTFKGGDILIERLIKAMNRNQLVTIMYISKTGEITKRRIKILNISKDTFKAYCFTKQAHRTFKIDQVLAMLPVI